MDNIPKNIWFLLGVVLAGCLLGWLLFASWALGAFIALCAGVAKMLFALEEMTHKQQKLSSMQRKLKTENAVLREDITSLQQHLAVLQMPLDTFVPAVNNAEKNNDAPPALDMTEKLIEDETVPSVLQDDNDIILHNIYEEEDLTVSQAASTTDVPQPVSTPTEGDSTQEHPNTDYSHLADDEQNQTDAELLVTTHYDLTPDDAEEEFETVTLTPDGQATTTPAVHNDEELSTPPSADDSNRIDAAASEEFVNLVPIAAPKKRASRKKKSSPSETEAVPSETEAVLNEEFATPVPEPEVVGQEEVLELTQPVDAPVAKLGATTVRKRNRSHLQHNMQKQKIIEALKQAIANEQIDILGQPIAKFGNQSPLFVEVFSHIKHLDGMNIPPSIYMQPAIEEGLIVDFDRTVLRRLFAHKSAFLAGETHTYQGIFCNLSPYALNDNSFCQELVRSLNIRATLRNEIVFELPLHVYSAHSGAAYEHLQGFVNAEFILSADNVHEHTVNLNTLAKHGVRFLKMGAASLIDGVAEAGQRTPLPDFMAKARAFDVYVIAERVETEEMYLKLQELGGVDYMQGYFVGRPALILSAEDQQHVDARSA